VVSFLNEYDETELRALARSFVFDACLPAAVLLGVFMPRAWSVYVKAKPVEMFTEENESDEDTARKTRISSFSSLRYLPGKMQKLRSSIRRDR